MRIICTNPFYNRRPPRMGCEISHALAAATNEKNTSEAKAK